MAWFPLYVNLEGNNCTIFGGNDEAAGYASVLLSFGAKVTVVSPDLCDKLAQMDRDLKIRYIPRRYFRGDCSSCYICIASTGSDALNISISDECKARAISVCVASPSAYGTFRFPVTALQGDITMSISGVPDDTRSRDLLEEGLRRAAETITVK